MVTAICAICTITKWLQNSFNSVTNSYKMVTIQELQNGYKLVTKWLQKLQNDDTIKTRSLAALARPARERSKFGLKDKKNRANRSRFWIARAIWCMRDFRSSILDPVHQYPRAIFISEKRKGALGKNNKTQSPM